MYGKPVDSIGFVGQFDPELAAMMGRELTRQQDGLELIASENFASPAVIAAMSSILTNKYAEGLPGKRYYGGCQFVDEIESLCIERAKACFGAEFANVQPHSGAQANMAVQLALLQPGDTMMGMSLANGGHLSHGSPANISGKYFNVVSYDVNHETGLIDYDQIRDMAKKCQPKLIIAGASAYPRTIDFKLFADIAHEVGAVLMVDMAHIAGLVAGGLLLGPAGVVGMLCGATASGFLLAVFMSNSGGSWDNAKKYIESDHFGGRGSENDKAAIVGDTIGDPFKDTSGPSINILIKLLSMVSIIFATLVVQYHLFG